MYYLLLIFWLLLANTNLHAQWTSDTIPPVAICKAQNLVLQLDNQGETWLHAKQIDSASYDNYGILSYQINGQDSIKLFCNQVSDYFILELSDSAYNSASCSVWVEVQDTIPPSLSCRQSLNIFLDSNGQTIVKTEDINFYSIDNCEISTASINGRPNLLYTCDSLPFSPFQVCLTMTDNYGNENSCYSILNLEDSIKPIANYYYNNIIYLDSMGLGTIAAIDVDSASYDNCSPVEIKINGAETWSFDCSALGLNNLLVSLKDSSNNINNSNISVLLKDTLKPKAYCQDVVVYLSTAGNAAISADDIDKGSIDNCGINTMLFEDGSYIKNYTCADRGVRTERLIITDNSANENTCTARVTILDTIAPVVVCNSININLTEEFTWILTVNEVGVAYDNCMIDTQYLTPSIFTCEDLGKKVFTLTVKDASGNTTICADTAFVFVEKPTILTPISEVLSLCIGDTLYLEGEVPNIGLTYNTIWKGPLGLIDTNSTNAIVYNVTSLDEGFYYFGTTPSGFVCRMKDSFYLEVDSCLLSKKEALLSDYNNNNLLVYPNPAQQYLTVESMNSQLISVELISMTGRSLFRKGVDNSLLKLDLEAYPQGLYLLIIETDTGFYPHKISILKP